MLFYPFYRFDLIAMRFLITSFHANESILTCERNILFFFINGIIDKNIF